MIFELIGGVSVLCLPSLCSCVRTRRPVFSGESGTFRTPVTCTTCLWNLQNDAASYGRPIKSEPPYPVCCFHLGSFCSIARASGTDIWRNHKLCVVVHFPIGGTVDKRFILRLTLIIWSQNRLSVQVL